MSLTVPPSNTLPNITPLPLSPSSTSGDLSGSSGNVQPTPISPASEQAAGIAAVEGLVAALQNGGTAMMMNQTPGAGINPTDVANANVNDPTLQAFRVGQGTTVTSPTGTDKPANGSTEEGGEKKTGGAKGPKGVGDADAEDEDLDPDDPASPLYDASAHMPAVTSVTAASNNTTNSATSS